MANKPRWQVSGTDATGKTHAVLIDANTRDSAIALAKRQGIEVTGATEVTVRHDALRPAVGGGGFHLPAVRLDDVSAGAAMKFGFFAAIGAAFVYIVVYFVLADAGSGGWCGTRRIEDFQRL